MGADGGDVGRGAMSPGVVTAYKVTAWVFVGSVLAQAFLAGRGWFVDFDLIEVHGYVGNATIVVAVAQIVLAYLATEASDRRWTLMGLSGGIVPLTFAQIGLGYVGRDEAEAAAWHVVNGVAIFGLGVAHGMLVLGVRR